MPRRVTSVGDPWARIKVPRRTVDAVPVICGRRFRTLLVAVAAAAATLLFASSALAANGFWTVQFEQPSDGTVQVDSQVPVMKEIDIDPLGLDQVVDYNYIEYEDDTASDSGELSEQQLTGQCSDSPGLSTPGLCSTPDSPVAHNLPSTDTELDVPITRTFDDISATINRPYFLPNHQITVTAVPDPGYYFNGWSGGGCGTDPTCQIAYLQDADISAEFSQCPNGASCLTLSTSPSALGAVTVHSGSESGPVVPTPSGCVNGLCTYQVTPGTKLALVPTASGSAEFDDWTGCQPSSTDDSCTITVNGNDRVNAAFDYPLIINKPAWEVAVLVTVNQQYIGFCNSSQCHYRLQPGDSVELDRDVEYPSDDGNYSAVLGWSGCSSNPASPDECDLTMNGADTVVPSYNDYWTVTVDQEAGGEVTSSPAGIDCGYANGQAVNECSATFPTDSTVTFTATAAAGYTAGGWNQGIAGPLSTGECASAGQAATCTDTLDHSPRPFGASFYPDLTTQVVGSGGVQTQATEAGGVPCASGAGSPSSDTSCEAFAPGSAIQITPTAFAGYSFGSFDGCDDVIPPESGNPSECQLTLNAPRTVTTTFDGQYSADVSVTSDSYGSVTMTPCPPATTCNTSGVGNFTALYDAATPVTLTETPSSQGLFTGWSGGGCSGTQPTCQTTIGAFLDSGETTHITANYAPASYLQVDILGQGTVTSWPAAISCPGTCAASFPLGSPPTLTAVPASGWSFAGWSGGGGIPCSGTGTCTPAITDTPAPVTATFVPAAPTSTTTPGTPTATAATLNGTVDPNGYATTYYFEWGTSTSYGTATVPVTVAAGVGALPVTSALSGLAPGTTYHYQLVATNAQGTTYGGDQTFTTMALPPTVSTSAATAIGAVDATLNGEINPNGYTTSYYFEYGSDPSQLDSTTPTQSAGSGASAVDVAATIGGLSPPSDYFWELVATNSQGTVTVAGDAASTVSGSEFQTVVESPTVTAQPVTSMAATTATINASINPNGSQTYYAVLCQSSGGASASAQGGPLAGGSTAVPVSLPVTGLTSNEPYSCSFTASNGESAVAGATITLNTARLAPDAGQSTFTANEGGAPSMPDQYSIPLTVTLKASSGQQIPYGGDTVRISSTLGTVSAVADNGDGSYSATLTPNRAGIATLTATVDGVQLAAQPAYTFTPGGLNGPTSPMTVGAQDTGTGQPITGNTLLLGEDSSPTLTVQAADADGSALDEAQTGCPGSCRVMLTEAFSDGESPVQFSGYSDSNGQFTASLQTPYGPATATITGQLQYESLTPVKVYFVDPTDVGTRWSDSGPASADGYSTATVTLQLTDAGGTALTGSLGPVAFTTNDPGAQISSVTDNGDGTYSAAVSSNAVQTVHLSAAFADHPGDVLTGTGTVSFLLPAASASLSTLTGPAQSVTDTDTGAVTATVVDAHGDPIQGATVNFHCNGSALPCATADTDSSGDATAQVPDALPGATGTEAVTADVDTAGGDVTLSASASVVFAAGPLDAGAATLDTDADLPSTPQQVGRPVIVTVTTRDAQGGAETTGGATVTLSSDLGTLSNVTDKGNGTYTASLSSAQVGTATITATVNGVVPTHTASAYFANPPADPNSEFTASVNSAVVGQSVTLSVHAVGADGYPLIGQSVAINCPLGNVSVITDRSGNASATCTADDAGTFTFGATIQSESLSATPAVAFAPGPTVPADSRLSYTAPSSSADPDSVQLDAVDSFGNLTGDGAHAVELHTTLGSFSSSGSVTNITAAPTSDGDPGHWSVGLYAAGATGVAHVTATVDGVPVTRALDVPLVATGGAATIGSSTNTGPGTDGSGEKTGASTGGAATPSTPPKLGSLGASASEHRVVSGLSVTVTNAKARSKVTLTIRAGGRTLATFKAMASGGGRATLRLHLSKKLATRYQGKKLTLRFAVTDSDGHPHTLSKTLKIAQ